MYVHYTDGASSSGVSDSESSDSVSQDELTETKPNTQQEFAPAIDQKFASVRIRGNVSTKLRLR